MKSWSLPPRIKIYEALGCWADQRVKIVSKQLGQVYASDKSKFYTVIYDGCKQITANDNGSYWKGYLGYPPIAFLMAQGKIGFDKQAAIALKSLPWKQLNLRFKYDYDKVIDFIHSDLKKSQIIKIQACVRSIYDQLKALQLEVYPWRLRPPKDLADSQKLFNLALKRLNLKV